MTQRYVFRKSFPLFITLFIITTSAFGQVGQGNFRFSNPKQFGFILQDVSFLDNNNGLAVGFAGGIAKTTDGGANWQYGVFTFTDATGMIQKPTFYDVHYVSSTIAYAVGTGGLLAKSTDGGINWTAVANPLTPSGNDVNALWFINKDTGYIAGEPLLTTLAPKVYVTRNGGATWDSLAAPNGTQSYIGYINNPTLPPVKATVSPVGKTIYRIVFVNDSVGYATGSGSQSTPFTNTTGGTSSSASASGGLIWKISKGVVTDYSLTKEKFNYTGIPTTAITPTTTYAVTNLPQQLIKAVAPVNDSVIVVASFNNGIAVRIRTGRNDSTASIVNPGTNIAGRYEILQYPNAPTQPTPPNPPVIPPQVLINSNMVNMKKAPNGALIVTTSGGRLGISTDTGSTWYLTQALPASTGFPTALLSAVDVTPNGRVIVMGSDGVVADSASGQAWRSNYKTVRPGAGINRMEFADCNNAVAVGGFGTLFTTADGGATWTDKTIANFQAALISMYGMSFPAPNRMYFSTSNGGVYNSVDQGTTNDLLFQDPKGGVIYNIATFGANRIYALGWRGSEASEKTVLFRSTNNGISWDTVKAFPLGTNAALAQGMKWVTQDTAYIGAQKGKVWRTTDGGATWTDISPFPAVNATASFNSIGVLDKNTIYVGTFTGGRIYKTTDAGATWTDVSLNISNEFTGTINDFLVHDANNVYAVMNSGKIAVTSNGGTSWTYVHSPSSSIFGAGAFVPKTVPAGTPISNRKAFIAGTGSNIMEYGTVLANVSSTEAVVNTNCTSASAGSITITATGGIAPYTYSINGGAFQTGNVFSGLTQGAKTIVIRDAGCGSITKTVNISFTDNLTVTANNDTTVCAGAPVQLNAVAATGATYSWSPATGLSATNIANPIATPTATTTYNVTATLGTCTKTEPVVITIRPSPAVSAGADKTIVAGDQVQLDGSATNIASVAWTPAATLTNANTLTPIAKPSATTTYTLTVRNTDNCTSTDDVVVNVIPVCVQVMNAFTPNGDGMNDRWRVTNGASCANAIQVAVFNRYGREVYRNNAYNNDWDGTYGGKPVPDGTYYYRVTLRLLNGSTSAVDGDVTILR